ncbi:hypothetical protein CDO73_09075 [Saccharibacillus sp. O23]|uniref:DUF6508 domain-containing protein n=1 Tax=Saccharibacillus sp. O23 TaxID=2009338 RepID=UPI000B4E6CFC|nr:DUF6508 domain-containing protein [Saccharibacillus sp. O23]OWR30737.1 hypothetical protein CDO73_09075 [Saccharibacillus sp. O23]
MNLFDTLTRHLPMLETEPAGEWIIDRENDGTPERPLRMPFVSYSETMSRFLDDFYSFAEDHEEMELNRYGDLLQSRGIEWNSESMRQADVSALDAQGVLALIMGAVRAERFAEGTLLDFFASGCMSKWLRRLRELG